MRSAVQGEFSFRLGRRENRPQSGLRAGAKAAITLRVMCLAASIALRVMEHRPNRAGQTATMRFGWATSSACSLPAHAALGGNNPKYPRRSKSAAVTVIRRQKPAWSRTYSSSAASLACS